MESEHREASNENEHLPRPDPDESPEPESISSPTTTIPSTPSAEQPPGYDPNRIPASVFSAKSGNPTDWSATSNESLFSIYMGNNSFSGDYAILYGNAASQSNLLMMPGELPRLEEWSGTASGDVSRKEDDLSLKFVSGQSMENHGKDNFACSEGLSHSAAAKKPPPSPSRLSTASGHSSSSFAFPVLESHDSGKNEMVKVAPESPVKPEKAEESEEQTQAEVSVEVPVGSSGTRWFCCFSCWPRFSSSS